MNVTILGIDLAKNTFSLHGVDGHGKTVLHKTHSRTKLLPFLAQLRACLIGLEACSGSHHWARQLTALGHRVGIIAQQLMTTPRVGVITATALLASVGDPHQFKNGRQFPAWLGLTPRQYTTDGKIRLGRTTKKGDYLTRARLLDRGGVHVAELKGTNGAQRNWRPF